MNSIIRYKDYDPLFELNKFNKPYIDIGSGSAKKKHAHWTVYILYPLLLTLVQAVQLFKKMKKSHRNSEIEDWEFKEVLQSIYDIKEIFIFQVNRVYNFLNKRKIRIIFDEIISTTDQEKCNILTKKINDLYFKKHDVTFYKDASDLVKNLSEGFGNMKEFQDSLNYIIFLMRRKNKDLDPYGEEDWGE